MLRFARALSLSVCAAAVLLASLRAAASVAIAYDLSRLVGASEHVVSGRVTRTASRYLGSQIVTDVHVEVDATGKGRSQRGEALDYVELGGSVEGITMRVEGATHPAIGDEALFFLARHPSGVLVAVGLSQGVMPIREVGGRRLVHPGGAGLVLMSRDRQGRPIPATPALSEPTPVEDVLDRVRAIAGGAP